MTPIRKITLGLLLLAGMILASPLHPAFAGNGVVTEKFGIVKVMATSGNVAAGVAAATIPAVPGKLNYITGFSITGTGATLGAPVVVTVTGMSGGTITFTVTAVAGVLLGNAPLNYEFPAPVPASAINTAIVVSCASLGTGSTNNVTNVFGYYASE